MISFSGGGRVDIRSSLFQLSSDTIPGFHMALKIVFAGTPEFACPLLRALLNSPHEVVAVYTQPDRPKGRGRQCQMSPVKQMALEQHLRIEQPLSLKTEEAARRLKKANADVMVVAAYGMLLPSLILSIPRRGCLNVHASLLPRWRGASPIQQAILAGDEKTGVTIMQMVAALDAGAMLAKRETHIDAADNSQTLHDRLSEMGAELMLMTLCQLEQGRLVPEPQDERLVTYAQKIQKQMAKIDWQQPVDVVARQVRAYYGWPVAYTSMGDKTLRIWEAQACLEDTIFSPGTLFVEKQQLCVACNPGVLKLEKIQLAGGKVVSARDFLNAEQKKITTHTVILG